MCSICLGLRAMFLSRAETAEKISALCLIGPEKAASESICSPSAIATEPVLPEVSTANIKGFGFICLSRTVVFFFVEALLWPKKGF